MSDEGSAWFDDLSSNDGSQPAWLALAMLPIVVTAVSTGTSDSARTLAEISSEHFALFRNF